MTSSLDARMAARIPRSQRYAMALGLFRKSEPKPAEPAAEAATPEPPHHDSAREILELLELELGAMIRQLERAANSVASGAQSSATTFSQAAEKFTHSAEGIGAQVRNAAKLADQASAAAHDASLNV